MSRRKKYKINSDADEFVYCGIWKCPHIQCIRHHIHEPWGVQIFERKFNPDKDWNYKDILEE